MNEESDSTNGAPQDDTAEGRETIRETIRESYEARRKEIIREFYRSLGAPSSDWLERLNEDGQRECIRQWIIKTRDPKIEIPLSHLVSRLDLLQYEENTRLPKYSEWSDRNYRKMLEENLRYGAIDMEDVNSPSPWVKYNLYNELCDQGWKLMVEKKQKTMGREKKLLYGVQTTLIVVAAALTLTDVYVAMWCAIIGGLATTFLGWA